jgi:hypothetical protein
MEHNEILSTTHLNLLNINCKLQYNEYYSIRQYKSSFIIIDSIDSTWILIL